MEEGKQKILLDTNILIHLLRRDKNVREHILQIGWNKCCISEISVVELLYGAECSANVNKNRALVRELIDHMQIIAFGICIEEFCKQKAQLRQKGQIIEDNDLYIASTALILGIPVASENVKHLSRIEGLEVQNWIKR